MNIIEAIILGLVQGLTEFIPVSSSGHLVVLHEVMGSTETGLAFDVALHLGTLFALIIFFWKDLLLMGKSVFVASPYRRLAMLLIMATVPAVIAGILLEGAAESAFRSPILVAVNLAFFGLVMLGAEKYSASVTHKNKDVIKTSRSQALIMGCAQALAIVPGVSRAGSTITAGLFAGMDRVAATRFSFLLGVPIFAGAAAKVLTDSAAAQQISDQTGVFAAGIMAAFLSGLFAIRFLLKFLAKHSLAVFAYYRLALATAIIIYFTLN